MNYQEYLTIENFIFLFVAYIGLAILIKFFKIIIKIASFILFAGTIYYYFMASPYQQVQIQECVKNSIEAKEISRSCEFLKK